MIEVNREIAEFDASWWANMPPSASTIRDNHRKRRITRPIAHLSIDLSSRRTVKDHDASRDSCERPSREAEEI